MNQTKKLRVLFWVTFLAFASVLSAQIPGKPNPPRLVNDFAGIFTAQQVAALEDSLVRFSKRTSNQVTIVTINDLAGLEASQFAYEIGEKWGVGSSKLDNGVVILIKPKNKTKGQVFIATGYGVEGVLPDASCSRIINNEMIPEFKLGDYFGGTVKALNVILPVLAKEYSVAEYEKKDNVFPILGLLAILGGIILFYVVLKASNEDDDNGHNGNSGTFGGRGRSGSDDIAAAILLGSMLGGGRSSRSSGGSFGGFGGFGGGSFGGGGAGGSW